MRHSLLLSPVVSSFSLFHAVYAFSQIQPITRPKPAIATSFPLAATVEKEQENAEVAALRHNVLQTISVFRDESNQYADQFGLPRANAAFYALFRAIRATPVPLNLQGDTFVLRHNEIVEALQQD